MWCRMVLSTSEELRLPLRWIAILFGRVGGSLAATTGVHTGLDAAKVLLAGGCGHDDLGVAAPRARARPDGGGRVAVVMAEHEHDSVAQLRASMSRSAMADPAGFERANYVRTLMSWSSHAQVSPGQASTDPVPAPGGPNGPPTAGPSAVGVPTGRVDAPSQAGAGTAVEEVPWSPAHAAEMTPTTSPTTPSA